MLRLEIEKISTLEKDEVRSQFEAIFKFANESIIVVNKKGVIQQVNPSGLALFGYKSDEIINQKIESLIPSRFKEGHVALRDGYISNPHARPMGKGVELFGLKKNGSEFPVEVSLSPYSTIEGDFIIAFIIDISSRKAEAEKEENYRKELEKEVENRTLVLKEAIRKLEKTKEELDESLKREKELNVIKSRFISIASHEFRTPLSAMLSSLNLIEKYNQLKQEDKRDKHINRIKKSIKLLTDILNDILSVNKLEEGKVIANPTPFNLTSFIEECINEISNLLKSGQRIKLINNDLPEIELYQDAKLLRHILLNLLSNAIKFSAENTSICITICKIAKANVLISVKDQGIGIPKQNQDQLFTRFFRAENVEQIQGTGLGLSIVAQYVQLMNGKIEFETTEGKGCEFYITIPLILTK